MGLAMTRPVRPVNKTLFSKMSFLHKTILYMQNVAIQYVTFYNLNTKKVKVGDCLRPLTNCDVSSLAVISASRRFQKGQCCCCIVLPEEAKTLRACIVSGFSPAIWWSCENKWRERHISWANIKCKNIHPKQRNAG